MSCSSSIEDIVMFNMATSPSLRPDVKENKAVKNFFISRFVSQAALYLYRSSTKDTNKIFAKLFKEGNDVYSNICHEDVFYPQSASIEEFNAIIPVIKALREMIRKSIAGEELSANEQTVVEYFASITPYYGKLKNEIDVVLICAALMDVLPKEYFDKYYNVSPNPEYIQISRNIHADMMELQEIEEVISNLESSYLFIVYFFALACIRPSLLASYVSCLCFSYPIDILWDYGLSLEHPVEITKNYGNLINAISPSIATKFNEQKRSTPDPQLISYIYALAGSSIPYENIPEEDAKTLSMLLNKYEENSRNSGSTQIQARMHVDAVAPFVYVLFSQIKRTNELYKSAPSSLKVLEIENEVYKDEQKIAELEQKLAETTAALEEANAKLRKVSKYESKISSLEEDVVNLKNELSDATEVIAALDKEIEEFESDSLKVNEKNEEVDNIDYEALINEVCSEKKVVVIGLPVPTIQKLSQTYPKLEMTEGFKELPKARNMVQSADILFLKPSHVAHKTFYMIKSERTDYHLLGKENLAKSIEKQIGDAIINAGIKNKDDFLITIDQELDAQFI